MRQWLLMTLLLLLPHLVDADTTRQRYEGSLVLFPGEAHTQPISGQVTLDFITETYVKSVNIHLEERIFGQEDFLSEESFGRILTIGESEQVAVGYQLFQTPHTFFFVIVANKERNNGDYSGQIFRVDQPRGLVETHFRQFIDIKHVPETWTQVGYLKLEKLDNSRNVAL